MIESEMKASLIVKDLERINSDIAQLERFLIKEDEKIAEALCKIIASIFWEIENPIIQEYPSVCPLVVVGEKYKKCIYRVVKSDRSAFTCCIVESKILPEDATRVLAEIENKYPENQDVRFRLEIESCIPTKENC